MGLKLLFIGAGKIAQSVIKPLIEGDKDLMIMAVAATSNNLSRFNSKQISTCLLTRETPTTVSKYHPDVVFLCVKPQIFVQTTGHLCDLLKNLSINCLIISVMAGINVSLIQTKLQTGFPQQNVIRGMFNVSAEIKESNAFVYMQPNIEKEKTATIMSLFKTFAPTTTVLNDESLIDVSTGIAGSGLAFLYEVIQAVSDVGVRNGLSRQDSLKAAAQLSIAAGKMCLETRKHPCELRDDVTSPAGTTIYGLSKWHENGTSDKICRAFQESINRSITIAQSNNTLLEKEERQ